MKPLTDKRLLGIWESDESRTPTAHQQRARTIVGESIMIYRRKTFTEIVRSSVSLGSSGFIFKGRYKVLASHESSLAILSQGVVGDSSIQHIRFVGNNRCSILDGWNREWLRRIKRLPTFRKKLVSLRRSLKESGMMDVVSDFRTKAELRARKNRQVRSKSVLGATT